MTRAHDQYYDEDRRRWPEYDFDTDDYTDPDDSMSIQDLAIQLALEKADEMRENYP